MSNLIGDAVKDHVEKSSRFAGAFLNLHCNAGIYGGKVARIEIVHEGGADSLRIHMDVVHRLDGRPPEDEGKPEPDTFTIVLSRLDSVGSGPFGLSLKGENGTLIIRLLTVQQVSNALECFFSDYMPT